MNLRRYLVIAAMAFATTACASNATKPQAPPAISAIETAPIEIIGSETNSASIASSTPAQVHDTADGAGIDYPPGIPADPASAAAYTVTPLAAGAPTSLDAVDAPSSSESLTEAERDAAVLYTEETVADPWQGFNRRMHSVNNGIDKYFARPLAIGYDKITPQPVQSSVSRFFKNLGGPGTAVNQLLQGRPIRALQSLGRFAVNATVGVGGLFDPATRFGMPNRDEEDFGQTLATWGWHDSRYLVMPLLGPRTVRDTVSMVGDQPLSPLGYVEDTGVANGLRILQLADGRAKALPMDEMRKQAPDEYALVRDAWMQRRNRQIKQDLRTTTD
jgi:phospholipid-binding lipoprotein MlaA